MSKHLIILCLFVLISTLTEAQISIYGKVADKNNIAIPYARIQINNDKTIFTNNDGAFRFIAISIPIKITISSLGYQTQELNINDSSFIQIRLVDKTEILGEFVVDGNYPNKLFDKAYTKLIKDQRYLSSGEAFYRMVSKNNKDYTELLEAFYSIKAKQSGFQVFEIINGRYAMDSSYKKKGYALSMDFTALIKLFDLTNDHRSSIQFPVFPFYKSAQKHYKFYNETSSQNTKYSGLSVIGFKPLNNNSKAFSGKLYVNNANGAMHRIEAFYQDNNPTILFANDPNRNVSNLSINYTINFTESTKGIMQISSVLLNLSYDTEKTGRKISNQTNIECVVYKANEPRKTNEHFNPQSQSSAFDYYQIFKKYYVKAFWDEQQILRPDNRQKLLTDYFTTNNFFVGSVSNSQIKESFKEFGYSIVSNERINFYNTQPPENLEYNTLSLSYNQQPVGALNSQLFMMQNCFKDSFYFLVIPILNNYQSWSSDTLNKNSSFPSILDLYRRLLLVHAHKLSNNLRLIQNPCKDNQQIDAVVNYANDELIKEEMELLNDLWVNKNFDFWNRYLAKEERLLKIQIE